ncbi:MAG: cysteine desulfurase family protein [Thermoanaerobaculia bacterium]
MRRTYFDHNATTPLDPRVRDAMLPWLGELHGNPSSVHAFGRAAQEAVEEARGQTASLLGAAPLELVFTASGTEANNTVILSSARRAGFAGHLILSAIEHPSVTAAAALAEELGVEVTRIAPAGDGRVDSASLLTAVRDDTFLVCLMLANNELGTLQPVAEVARGCREQGVAVLCDAVQAVGKIPVEVENLEVDYLTLGAHKFYGPLGAAALWVRKGADLTPLLIGGGQERHRRASTVNVPAVVGLGAAAEIARREMPERQLQLASLRDHFEEGLGKLDVVVHGDSVPRLPNTSHIALAGVDGEALMIRLDLAGYAVSTGAACSSGTVEPSQTLLALGMTSQEALSSLRVSFGISNKAAEVDDFLEVLTKEVAVLRSRAADEPSP